jgi:pseudouridine kinase
MSATGGYALVIGAVHIDVIADYAAAQIDKLDRIGRVRYSIGGTGYNLAVNLAQGYVPTAFLSVVKKGSFSSVWIRTRLREAGVALDYLQTSDRIDESGFVAVRKNHELEIAVTSTTISSLPIDRGLVERALDGAKIVLADCNLSEDQLSLIVETANQLGKPMLVAGVSDSKAMRVLELPERLTVDVLSLNERELAAIELAPLDEMTAQQTAELCSRMRAKNIVVTRGKHGHVVLSRHGTKQLFNAPTTDRLVSSTGAGDALLAGLAASWYQEGSLDWQRSYTAIARYVRRVLEEEGATVGSLAREMDFRVLAETAMRETRLTLYERVMQAHLVPWFTIIGGAAALIALFLMT